MDITAAVTQRLISITMTDNRGMEADTLDVQLSDHDGRLSIPPRNAKLELWLGWASTGLVYKGSYTVDETEHSGTPDVISIRARSADLREALKAKRECTWHQLTLGEILTTVAARNGLSVKIIDALADQVIAHIDQANESDANIITRLAEQFDAVIGIKASTLMCTQAGAGKSAGGLNLPHIKLKREDGDSHRFLQADRNAYSGVKAYYYESNEADKKEAIAGGGDNIKELRGVFSDQKSAARAAKSEFTRLLRGGASLSYTLALGRADLTPELTYSLLGVKDDIDAVVWLGKQVQHTFNSSGFITSLELENQLPELADITELADIVESYTGIEAYYKDKAGKQQRVTKGDQSKPKRLAHLYASKASANTAVSREMNRINPAP